MHQKGLVNVVLLILVVAISLGVVYRDYGDKIIETLGGGKLQECPEAWYENRMPSVFEDTREESQYFVYKGERRELTEFDLGWVKKNCGIWPEVVY